MIIDYKFNDKSYLYELFEKCIIKNKNACNFLKSYDIIIPVPLHRKKKLQRGYNQCELIAKEIIKYLNNNQCNILLETKALKKIKNTKPQSLKNLNERKLSVIDSYYVDDKSKILSKNILLFDDIYTTGSTCMECKKMLLQAGAKNVGIFCIAKDLFLI